jgi:HAD domain in Swiss Army Knife RNA repair proteins
MKILFLDIDGVLNSADYMKNRRTIPRPTPHSIDAPTIPRLNAIIERTGAKVVVSSTWRMGRDKHDLQSILRAHGFIGEIIGCTPIGYGSMPSGVLVTDCVRGHEIQAWLDEHSDVTTFAIVDDNSDMAHLTHRLVQTTWSYGLLDEHVERLVQMLGGA